jgi:hypothetical protein
MVNGMLGTFTVIIQRDTFRILFDGYESHVASKIVFHQIKPYITVNTAFTSDDQTSLDHPVQITYTLQRNKVSLRQTGLLRK